MNYITSNSTYGNWYNGRQRVTLSQQIYIKKNTINLLTLRMISKIDISKTQKACPICIGSQKNKVIRKLNCGHDFHIECIDRWFENRNTCPICRKKF